MWDAYFSNGVPAFRLCLLTRGRCGKGIRTNGSTHGYFRRPFLTSVICSRRRGNELRSLWRLVNWGAHARTAGAVFNSCISGWLHRRYGPHRFGSVIKEAGPTGVVILLIASLLASCTSMTNDTISDPSASQSGAAVPGEKMSDDQRYAPGPMGSGNVRW